MIIKGIEVPDTLTDAVKEINKLYFEANKERIKEAQKRYREKAKNIPKTEEQIQKIREYANNYYQTKLKDKLKQKRDFKKALATLESPTLESPTLESPTLESPTLESPTLESPTLKVVYF